MQQDFGRETGPRKECAKRMGCESEARICSYSYSKVEMLPARRQTSDQARGCRQSDNTPSVVKSRDP